MCVTLSHVPSSSHCSHINYNSECLRLEFEQFLMKELGAEQEEMDRRNGFWWSPDSRFIAFAEVDAAGIPPFRIMHQGKATVGGDAEEDHAYPFAGHANVSVRLGVVPATGGSVVWMDLVCGLWGEGHEDEEYLARVAWLPNGFLTAQVQNRLQTKLKLLKFDPVTGRRTVLLTEESNIWVNLHDCFTPLQRCSGRLAGGFIWASERTGFRHLYLHDEYGNCLGALTQGSWIVEQVSRVDENAGLVYFTGTYDSPLETHLYSTNLYVDSSQTLAEPKRLTQGAGRHIVVLDHQMQKFVDIHDSLDTPPRVLLCSLDTGKLLVSIYEQPAPAYHARRLQLTPPEFRTLTASDGTPLHGLVYIPDSKQFGRPPYRAVVSVYGGPNVQIVCNSWMNTVDMRAQYLRSRGILVWKVCLFLPGLHLAQATLTSICFLLVNFMIHCSYIIILWLLIDAVYDLLYALLTGALSATC